MQYLGYQEYLAIGGICDMTAFERNMARVSGIVDNATHCRIKTKEEVPGQVKALCRDLVEYLARNKTTDVAVSSRSQSVGAVSESESYVVKSKEELQSDIDEMIFDYLGSVTDYNGTPLLYRGAMR